MTETTYTPWQLARLAGCADPDSPDSPGAAFLRTVADATRELLEDGSWDDDTADEIADGCVPVYTHELWQTFVDIAAYREDLDDIGGSSGDMTKDAGVALYLIASRLVRAIAEDAQPYALAPGVRVVDGAARYSADWL